jgi:hypothetical protein
VRRTREPTPRAYLENQRVSFNANPFTFAGATKTEGVFVCFGPFYHGLSLI